jgi:hypothetical protein
MAFLVDCDMGKALRQKSFVGCGKEYIPGRDEQWSG